MSQRLNFSATAREAYGSVVNLESYVQANIESTLLHLIKLRASILNGCSYCVDMHSRDALAEGEDTRRLFGAGAWQESSLFTEPERAALALTDSVTRLGHDGVPDNVWDTAAAFWDERGMADLLTAIATINVWNRLMVATRQAPPVAV